MLSKKRERERRGGIDTERPITFHHSATWKPDMLKQSRALRDLRMQKTSSSVFCKLLTGTFFSDYEQRRIDYSFKKNKAVRFGIEHGNGEVQKQEL